MPIEHGCTISALTLTAEEARFILQFCILRPLNRAADLLQEAIPEHEDLDHKNDIAQDLLTAAPIYEGIRTKLVEAIRRRSN